MRYAMACLSYECFNLRAARLSCKFLGQGYVRECLQSSLRKFYGRYGNFFKYNKATLSQVLHDILGHDHIQWYPPLIRHFTNSWPYYRTGSYCRFWRYYLIPSGSIGHLQRMCLANRGCLPLWTPGHVPFGTCICSNVETIHSWTCHVYGPFEFRTSVDTSIFAKERYRCSSLQFHFQYSECILLKLVSFNVTWLFGVGLYWCAYIYWKSGSEGFRCTRIYGKRSFLVNSGWQFLVTWQCSANDCSAGKETQII